MYLFLHSPVPANNFLDRIAILLQSISYYFCWLYASNMQSFLQNNPCIFNLSLLAYMPSKNSKLVIDNPKPIAVSFYLDVRLVYMPCCGLYDFSTRNWLFSC